MDTPYLVRAVYVAGREGVEAAMGTKTGME